MKGHKYVFYGEIWLIIPKLFLLNLLIRSIVMEQELSKNTTFYLSVSPKQKSTKTLKTNGYMWVMRCKTILKLLTFIKPGICFSISSTSGIKYQNN